MQADSPSRSTLTPQARDAQARFDRELDQATCEVQALRTLQQRFLAGDLVKPPIGQAARLQAKLRSLRVRARGVGSQFRLNAIEARLQSHLDLFNRRLNDRERSQNEPGVAPKPTYDPEKGVVIGGGADEGAETALYQRLTRDPRAAERLDPSRFRALLARHLETIRDKTGCREVVFRVVFDQDGKPKLKAKPVKTA